MPVLTTEERIGTTIAGKYRLEGVLGEGGFGVVLRGVHAWTGRPIAVKILDHKLAKQEDFVQRFLREARAAAKLGHPNVVGVLDMGREEDGTAYLVLELLEGEELSTRIQRGAPFSLRQTLEYAMPIMDALATAHGHGIVHRDLKPANIFLSRDTRGQLVPKLLDFGIAKDAADTSLSTRTGEIYGTPHYMSPEQAMGVTSVGPDTDVWAMGVVLYECLSGARPYDGPSVAAMLAKLVSSPAPDIAGVEPEVPAPFASIVMKALSHDRAARYPDMGALLEAVIGCAEELGCVPDSAAPIVRASRLQSTSTVADARQTEMASPERGVDAEPTAVATPSSQIGLVASGVARTQRTPAAAQTRPAPSRPPRSVWWLALGALACAGAAVLALTALWPTGSEPAEIEASADGDAPSVGAAPTSAPPSSVTVPPSDVTSPPSEETAPPSARVAPDPGEAVAAPEEEEPAEEATPHDTTDDEATTGSAEAVAARARARRDARRGARTHERGLRPRPIPLAPSPRAPEPPPRGRPGGIFDIR